MWWGKMQEENHIMQVWSNEREEVLGGYVGKICKGFVPEEQDSTYSSPLCTHRLLMLSLHWNG